MKILTMVITAWALSATLGAQVPDFTPQTPLIGALLHADRAAAKRLLESGADPNEGQFFGMPPLLLAILRQDLELVRLLQAKGADVTVRDRSGSTPLMWAAFSETGDVPVSVSYALLSLFAGRHAADEVTDAMARVIAAWQSDDGAFHPLPALRPPIEAGTVTATALSLRALQLYGANQAERVERASHWLRRATPRTTEERAMQLLGLAWAKAPADVVRRSADALLHEQRPDGGWAQLATLETDAYATGQALVALQTAGHSIASPEYRRGVAFLVRTQFRDGSWLVRSRTFPVQPLKESGFPHGTHQWISAAGTSWATLALALALPPPASSGTFQ